MASKKRSVATRFLNTPESVAERLRQGWNLCKFHGTRDGAPKGETDGAYRNRLYTSEAIEERKALAELLKAMKSLSVAI